MLVEDVAKIPKFETSEEAAGFCDTNDFEEYVDDTEAVTCDVRISARRIMLTAPLPLKVYEQLEALASRQGVRVANLVAAWLKQKVVVESRAK
jgi:hypothetical protein